MTTGEPLGEPSTRMPPQTMYNEPNKTIKEMYSKSRSTIASRPVQPKWKTMSPASGSANKAATFPLFAFASHQDPAKTGSRAIATSNSTNGITETRGSRSPSGASSGGTPGT